MGKSKRRACGLVGTVLIVMLLVFICAGNTKAADRTVRIGYFHVSGYQEITNEGNRWGFGYDYLQEIAKYTNWEYVFVDGTWDECLAMLEEGEIDLLTCAKKSPEREELFDFSVNRMGMLCSVLTVDEGNDTYSYNDFAGFDGIKVGTMRGNRANDELDSLCSDYGINMEENTYDSEAQMKEALANGEIDAVVSSDQRILSDEKIIARFNQGPFYAITKKGNTDLMQELDAAMQQILYDNPYFEVLLNEKYFGENAGYKIALTKEEKEYVEKNKKIRIAVLPNVESMFYYDGEKYSGIIADSVHAMAQEVGLEIEYVNAGSYKEVIDLLQEGKADMIGDFYYDYSWGERNGFILTKPYMEVEYIEVFRQAVKQEPGQTKVAACENSFFNDIYVLKHYSEDQMLYYPSESDCLEAVRKGEADITFINEYTAKALLAQDKYLRLDSSTLYGTNHNISVAVLKENKMLNQVFNKAICNLNSNKMKLIKEKYTEKHSEDVSLLSYIYYNLSEFVFILGILFLILILVLVYIIIVKRKYNRHIFKLAYFDSLTGLNNIYRFEELVDKKWIEYRGKGIFILSFDISHFTTINETYGRAAGDLTICYVAERIKEIYGEIGVVARSKVDNFLVFGIYSKQEEYKTLVTKIKENIGIFPYEDKDITLSYNFGIVLDRGTASTSIKKMTDRAEMARKAAKKDSGHLRYFNDEMEEELLKEKMIEDCMESALENGEFVVHYQPKCRMSDAKIIGAEALVRWENKECGMMNPGEFIPIFEENGFVVELDFFVMEQVYKMLRKRLDHGDPVVRISINQSRIHFIRNNYIERLNALRQKYQIPHDLIELELTESIFASMADISNMVGQLKNNGYYLSVDDFGSGYSSLNMLKEIPLDTLKIDKDFLSTKNENDRYRKVIKKVVELAEELNMNIICEGVEKEEQAQFLQSIGCLYAQGFLYAKPLTEERFLAMLQSSNQS